MDGLQQGDTMAAPRIFVDPQLARLGEEGRVDWNPFREKLWIRHRALSQR